MQTIPAIIPALLIVFSCWAFFLWLHERAVKKEFGNDHRIGKKINLPKMVDDTLDEFEKKLS